MGIKQTSQTNSLGPRRMERNKNTLQKFFENFRGFWGDLGILVIQEKLGRWYEHFQRNYPEVFTVEEKIISTVSRMNWKLDLSQTWLKLRKGLWLIERQIGSRIMKVYWMTSN